MSSTSTQDRDLLDGETISRNATLALAAQLAGAVFTAGITLFLARELGTHGFGVFSLALGVGGLVLLPSDFGISAASARFVAEHRGDRRRVAAVLADSLRIKLLASAAVAALLFALAGPIANAYGIHALAWALRGIAIALFGQSFMMMGSAFEALARVRFELLTALVESSTETVACLALVLAGAGVTGAAFGRAIGFLAGGAMTVLALWRIVGPGVLPRGLRLGAETRRIATYAGVLLVIDGAYTLYNQIDILIIGAYLGASAVGVFSAPYRLMTFISYPGNAVTVGVAPRLVRNQREEPNVDAFSGALRLMLIVQGAFTAAILGWAPLIVKVALGSRYAESVEVLRVLAPSIFLLGIGALVSVSANYLGEARRRVPIAIGTVIVNFVLDMILVPRVGVIGGAIGTDVAYALYVPAHLVLCQRILRVDLRPAALTLARTFVAGGVMTGVLLLIGSPLGEAWRIPLGGLAGCVGFALVLWATREVDPRELRALFARSPFFAERRGKVPAGGGPPGQTDGA